ncbi:formyltransferase family protein [Pontiellaceae bacterium B12227]|nr:formyltransferase family protein [Pontiellaceae bacterium B12227]
MKIDILCSSQDHPVRPFLYDWAEQFSGSHEINIVSECAQCSGGELLFLISCTEIVGAECRAEYGAVLVIHASDLPEGRGWSPLVWQVLEGRDEITLTLFEAADKVDDGLVWKKSTIEVEAHELADEINEKLFRAEIDLMSYAVEYFGRVQAVPQAKEGKTYYRKRIPEDSRIDPDRTIREQFDMLRIADPERYPAFIELHGHKYKIILEKF